MKFPMFVVIVIIFVTIFTKTRRRVEERERQSIDEFWERESESNAAPPADISHLDYVDFSRVTLPFARFSDDILAECEKQVRTLSTRKVLNLTGISNTALKLTYGMANLPLLTQYDENFILLARTLNRWGHRLYELDHPSEAKTVLEFAVSIGSDMKATYELLQSIYQKNGDSAKLQKLIESAKTLHSLMKQPILDMLKAS